jgi:hypothetical protein
MKRAILIVAAAVVSTTVSAEPVEVITPQNKTLGSANGRYVFGQISQLRRDQYMLDTQTGRLWQVVQSKDESLVLQVVPYVQIDGKLRLTADAD